MSSEEEDYMSEALLKTCEADIRPGLIHNRSEKRSLEVSKKRQLEEEARRKKPLRVVENENRAEGLDTPIAPNNKGFEMLKKMGFNPGSGLGAKGQGRAEPVKIEVKNNKEGLGRKEALRELIEKKRKKWKEAKNNTPSLLDYRAGLVAKEKERKACADLGKSQSSCYNLDTKNGITEPEEEWFWPKKLLKKEDSEEEDDEKEEEKEELSTQDKLELLTVYLRTNYNYCIWCGVEYENADDMENSCPGSTKDDH
ncbi:G patch domain-containing protein 11 isoform X2 [Cimex lectularius]|uniref:G patch domain-containing protein 11 n=1 Tax=Cimex lectularius TaxID=79782 RepID=A0A8I6RUB7_CIMLE|nr:G patch domain-containing protein 11 isoform X2 [Cimex lectularius]